MTKQERVELTKSILEDLLQNCEMNPIHREYVQSLLQRIDSEIVPNVDQMPERASFVLLEEILKASSVIIFSSNKKVPSCRVTKKAINHYFSPGKPVENSFQEMKASRYGMAMLNMNINKFMEIMKK